MELKDILNEYRLKKKLDIKDIAKEIRKPVNLVRSWFNSEGYISSTDIHLLADILGINHIELESHVLFNKPVNAVNTNEISVNYTKFNKVVVQNKDIAKKDNVPIIPIDGSCTFPGCRNQASENCHFTGYDQAIFGKGLSKKVSNLFVADLCHDHHIYFDQPKERKSERMSSEFKTCILLSIKRKADRGIIVFNKKVK